MTNAPSPLVSLKSLKSLAVGAVALAPAGLLSAAFATAVLAVLAPAKAFATEINGFKVESISPTDVQDRFGRSEPFKISLAECEYFLSISHEACSLVTDGTTDSDVVASDTTTTTDATTTVDDALSTVDDATSDVDDVTTDDTSVEVDALGITDDATPVETDVSEPTDVVDPSDTTPAGAPGKADSAVSTALTLTIQMSSSSAVTTTTGTAIAYTQVGWAVGKSCATDAEPKDDGTNCQVLKTLTDRSSWSGIEIKVDLADVLSAKCASDDDTYVWVYAKAEGGAINTSKIQFVADYAPPTAPTIEGAAAGEKNVTVSWADASSEDGLKHKVYWSTREFGSVDVADGATDVSSSGELTADGEYQVTGLTNGQLYYFGVTAIDDYGNESQICNTSALLSATPKELDDFYEYYRKRGGKETGGYSFCFVATAAWGSPIAPAVNWLRAFRDQRMMASAGGRALVALYGEVGPKAAAVIRENPTLRAIARGLLWPLVGLVVLVMAVPAWGPVAALLTLIGLGSWVRRRRSNAQSQESGR